MPGKEIYTGFLIMLFLKLLLKDKITAYGRVDQDAENE